MIERLKSLKKPNFFFMSYFLKNYEINDFFIVPKYFFVPEIIEKRKELSENAKRAGWIGSNILFSKIPNSGKIYYIKNGKEFSKEEVLKK
jgi:type II restriction enzyme